MHIIDVFGGEKLPVSFEIFPPKGDLPVEEAREVIGGLAPLSPSFVSVTYSAGGSGNSSRTIDVAKMAQDEYGLNMMAHLTCMNADRAGIDSVLASMKAAGIENVLALRGDAVPGATPKDFKFAKDLIPVAREAGITVPITFGIMPFLSKAQIQRMVFMCGASLPSPIIKLLARYEDDAKALRQAGIDYACQQFVGLSKEGVDGLHVYTMNRPDIAQAAVQALRDAGAIA